MSFPNEKHVKRTRCTHDYIGENCPNPAGCYAMGECAMCGGCGMVPGTKPDDDMINTPCPECNPQPLP